MIAFIQETAITEGSGINGINPVSSIELLGKTPLRSVFYTLGVLAATEYSRAKILSNFLFNNKHGIFIESLFRNVMRKM
jgi:hypothetical protein